MVSNSTGAGGEALHASVAASTFRLLSVSIESIVSCSTLEFLKALAIDHDRIALKPFLEFARGPVFGRVGARMAGMAIGQAFDERGTAALARLFERGERSPIDDVGIVAIDDDALKTVGRRAIACGMFHRRHVADRRVLHIKIVLADENDRQLPDGGEIERLVKSPDIGRAVAEETDRHVFLAEILRAPGRAAGDWQMRADDRIRPEHAVLDRSQMHRAALATHQADVAQHQLAEHALHRGAPGERMRMAAIGAE